MSDKVGSLRDRFSHDAAHFLCQHRCVSIFNDKKTNQPTGFALGSIEGRVAIHYVNPANPKDNFTFKCHRSNGSTNGMQDIYAVSSIFDKWTFPCGQGHFNSQGHQE